MFSRCELYVTEVIRERRTGFLPLFLKGALRLLSWGFKTGVSLRNWAYDFGLFRQYVPPIPVVVSIGNIAAGGTGKTPTTLLLAQKFYEEAQVAILSRGYRSKIEKWPTPVVICNGNGPLHTAGYSGDEPYLFAERLPKAFVYVGKDRQRTSNMAAKAGATVLLLDDGLQHRSLARDYELITLDARDPFGRGYFLPRGFLREGKQALKRASLVLVNHIEDREKYAALKQILSHYTKAPIVGTKMHAEEIYTLPGEPAEALEGKKVAAFCGIADPLHFVDSLKEVGADVVLTRFVPDHESFSEKALLRFAKRAEAAGAECLVCTEKDKVKLPKSMQCCLPIFWLKVDLLFIDGEEEWDALIANVRSTLLSSKTGEPAL